MVVMALDHGRDFFHSAAMRGSPTDLATTRNALASADHRSERMVAIPYRGHRTKPSPSST
jgi:hypothetical protein